MYGNLWSTPGLYSGATFLIYVSVSVSEDCKLSLYADDSAILFVHINVNVLSEKLSKVLESCFQTCSLIIVYRYI